MPLEGQVLKVVNSARMKLTNTTQNCREMSDLKAFFSCKEADLSADNKTFNIVWAVKNFMESICARVGLFPGFLVPVLSGNDSDHETFEVKEQREGCDEHDIGGDDYDEQALMAKSRKDIKR